MFLIRTIVSVILAFLNGGVGLCGSLYLPGVRLWYFGLLFRKKCQANAELCQVSKLKHIRIFYSY